MAVAVVGEKEVGSITNLYATPVTRLEFLLGKYCASSDELAIQMGLQVVNDTLSNNYIRPDESAKAQSKVKENGKVTFDDIVHTDTYMPLVDEHGKTIPPNSEELNVAPVNP